MSRATVRLAERIRTVAVLMVLFAAPPRLPAQNDGIFADFTSSMGNFTCRLEYVAAPMAVANFIGLATGERAWIDLPSGRVRTNAFFNGLTFHRVIAGFMIQGGSPNGTGDDGPGYAFPDEFDPSLRHDGPGVLSLANSGPDSNGSQFFITATNTPWLDDVHTIFGRVVSGQSVVDAINHVVTDADDKPLTNVVIQTVSIRRVGIAAQAFDIDAQNLPVVSGVRVGIERGIGEVILSFTNQQFAHNRLSISTNLASWTAQDLGIETAPAPPQTIRRATPAASGFYAMSQVQYPSSTFAPPSVRQRTLTLIFAGGMPVLTIAFDATDGGTYTYSQGNPGTVTSYTWLQEPYRGRLWPIYFSGLVPMTLRLDFTSDTAGAFVGTAYTTVPAQVSGAFTLTGP